MPGILIVLLGLSFGFLTGAFKRVPNQKIIEGSVVSCERHNFDGSHIKYFANVEYYVDDRP